MMYLKHTFWYKTAKGLKSDLEHLYSFVFFLYKNRKSFKLILINNFLCSAQDFSFQEFKLLKI